MDHDIKKLQNALNAWLAVELHKQHVTYDIDQCHSWQNNLEETYVQYFPRTANQSRGLERYASVPSR